MFLRARRLAVPALVAFSLSACSSIGSNSATPALSNQANATGVHVLFRKSTIDMSKAPASTPFLISFVEAGVAQGGVPCINCVSGAQTGDNIGLTGPGNYVPSGAAWQYSLAFTNLSFKGTCKLAWSITHGTKVIDKFSASLKLTQAGGFVLYGLNRARPSYSGAALLTGKVQCGSGAAQTAQAPLYYQ